MNFRPLSKEFYSNKCQFLQVQRNGNVAFYKKEKIRPILNPNPAEIEYHVIIIEQRKGYKYEGKYFDPAEYYPIKYFSFNKKEEAIEKFDELKKSTT